MTENALLEVDNRLVELETRLAFQEQALTELSDALAALRSKTALSAERLRQVLEQQAAQSRGEQFADVAAEPPPPHY